MIKKRFTAILILFVLLFLFLLPACQKATTTKSDNDDLVLSKDGTFKILYLTDLHFINSQVTSKYVADDLSLRDEWAMTAVRDIVEKAGHIDLIVVTGDLVFTTSLVEFITETSDNLAAFKKATDFIDSFGIPWAFCFGNHDEEGNAANTSNKAKKLLASYLQSDNVKHCLFTEGPQEINGCGNYLLNVYNEDGSVNNSLVFFDSGSYIKYYDESLKKEVGGIWNYEYVHDDQLDWYEGEIKKLSTEERTVPSIVFQHIPLPIYQEVLDAYIAKLNEIEMLNETEKDWHDTINYQWVYGTEKTLDTEIGPITYHGGVCNKENQEVCHSFIGTYNGVEYDGGHEFEKILSLGSTKYVFCGHDHRNTFSFTYKGVRLSYGMSIDYSAVGLLPPEIYPKQDIYNETEQRGGTLITLHKDSSVTVSQIPFTRNLYQEELEKRKVKR